MAVVAIPQKNSLKDWFGKLAASLRGGISVPQNLITRTVIRNCFSLHYHHNLCIIQLRAGL